MKRNFVVIIQLSMAIVISVISVFVVRQSAVTKRSFIRFTVKIGSVLICSDDKMLAALGFKISLITVVNIISCVLSVQQHDYPVNLYVAEPQHNNQKYTIINRNIEENTEDVLERKKRDATTVPPHPLETHKNISTWVMFISLLI